MVSRIVCVGAELSSRVASHRVLSPQQSLTSVFGMGTGGPSALKAPTQYGTPYFWSVSNELSSRAASRRVLSPQQSLTSVFGMGTGGPSALKSLTSVIKKDHREPKKKTSRQCVVANLNLEVQALGQLVPVS